MNSLKEHKNESNDRPYLKRIVFDFKELVYARLISEAWKDMK